MDEGGREGGGEEEEEKEGEKEGQDEWRCVLVLTFNEMMVDEGSGSENI